MAWLLLLVVLPFFVHFSHLDIAIADTLHLILQKMIFLDTDQRVDVTLRPYWSDATKGRASVVQAVPYMLEIVPVGTSKGNGVKVLLDHFGVTAKEVPQISVHLTLIALSVSPRLLTVTLFTHKNGRGGNI